MTNIKKYKNFIGDAVRSESADLDLDRTDDFVNFTLGDPTNMFDGPSGGLDGITGLSPTGTSLVGGSTSSSSGGNLNLTSLNTSSNTSSSGSSSTSSLCSDPEFAKKYPIMCGGSTQDRLTTALTQAGSKDDSNKGGGLGQVLAGITAGFGKGFGLTDQNQQQQQTAQTAQTVDEDDEKTKPNKDWIIIAGVAAIGLAVIMFAVNTNKKASPDFVVPPVPQGA